MRLFTCTRYNAKMTTEACVARYKLVNSATVTSTDRNEKRKCFACDVGACHKRGVDAPGVGYVDKTIAVPKAAAPAPKKKATRPNPTIVGQKVPAGVKRYGPGEKVPLANGETFTVPPVTPFAVYPLEDLSKPDPNYVPKPPQVLPPPSFKLKDVPPSAPHPPSDPPPQPTEGKRYKPKPCRKCEEMFTPDAPARVTCPKCKGEQPSPAPAADSPAELTEHSESDPPEHSDAWLKEHARRFFAQPPPLAMATPRQVLAAAGFDVQEMRTPSGWVLVIEEPRRA